jgi:hypothetical protein
VSLEETVRDLRSLGLACTVLPTGAEGALVVVPECGRVLGLWPHWRGASTLWIEPAFLEALRAGTRDDAWQCPGGDAMRLAPARQYLGEDGSPPRCLDPGRWEQADEKGLCVLVNAGDAWARQEGQRVRFRIVRRLRPLGEQEMEERWGTASVRRAGYEEEAVLEMPGRRVPATGLCNRLRVRPGGRARVPLRRYWGDTSLAGLPPGAVGLEDACAVLCLRGDDPAVLEIGSPDARPRIMYQEEGEQGRATLLVRDFDGAGPGRGEFVRLAWPGVRGPGEISCFSPLLAGQGSERAGSSRLGWKLALAAFSGREAEIAGLARRLSRGG